MRFVAVSATIANIEDLAQWLGTDDAPANFFKYDPCPQKLPSYNAIICLLKLRLAAAASAGKLFWAAYIACNWLAFAAH